MPNVKIPAAMRRFTANNAEVAVAATSVRDAIAQLEKTHPGIAARLLDAKGAVKPYIKIFVGSDDIGGLSGLDTQIKETDELSIVPAIAGG